MGLPHDLLAEAYRRMKRIRVFEETAKEMVFKGELYGAFHTSTGQEASIVGTCLNLDPTDYMVGTHRSHGHPIGKGADPGPLMAELMGRRNGVNGGFGGSMHLSDFSVGSLGETSIVGSGLPVGTGAGLGCKLLGNGRVSLVFFGDGASNEGTFHESLNLAAIWDLPVVFVCENNGYGEFTAASKVIATDTIAQRALAYDIPGVTVDGQDVDAVYDAVAEAVRRARAGEGPSLVETVTYRYENHAVGLPHEDYRTPDEVQQWRTERDPIDNFLRRYRDQGIAAHELDAIDQEVDEQIEAAVEFGRAGEEPTPDEAFDHVYTHPITIHR